MTLIVNLFAGPGAGKSTTRAGVFHNLKLAGYNVEEATEFAKILTWEKRVMAFTCQPYIFGEQLYSLHRLVGQVDAVITDSPLLLSSVYAPDHEPASLHQLVMDKFDTFKNVNFYIQRTKVYNEAGRNQTYEEALDIDQIVLNYLQRNHVKVRTVFGDENAAHIISNIVKGLLDGS